MTTRKTYMKDSLLKNLIHKHKGLENAISTNQICTQFNEWGKPINARSLPQIIKRLRYERGLPICYKRGKGYFWAKTKQDIFTTIEDLQNQIYALHTTINFMKGFILE